MHNYEDIVKWLIRSHDFMLCKEHQSLLTWISVFFKHPGHNLIGIIL